MYGYCDHYGYGMNYGWFNGYLWIVILIILTVIAYSLFRIIFNNKSYQSNNYLNILKTKYVNGELSEEEYLRKKDIIKRK